MNYSGKKSTCFIYEGNLTVQIRKVGVFLPVILINSIRAGFERDKALSPAEEQQKDGLSC